MKPGAAPASAQEARAKLRSTLAHLLTEQAASDRTAFAAVLPAALRRLHTGNAVRFGLRP